MLRDLSYVVIGFVAMLLVGVGCVPARGTMPAQTWRVDEPSRQCEPDALADTRGAWSRSSLIALARALERDEVVVVRALGCRVEVLNGCTAPGSYQRGAEGHRLEGEAVSAQDLDGVCEGATHFVRSASEQTFAVRERDDALRAPSSVELAALELGDFDLSGTWTGVMRQPNGPYEVYNIVLDVVQNGDRVRGTSRLETLDQAYWGEIEFEGRLEGNTLFFADVEVVDDNLGIFLEWCGKGGYLIVDPLAGRLEGPWRAPFCASGSLDLQREAGAASERELVELVRASGPRSQASRPELPRR